MPLDVTEAHRQEWVAQELARLSRANHDLTQQVAGLEKQLDEYAKFTYTRGGQFFRLQQSLVTAGELLKEAYATGTHHEWNERYLAWRKKQREQEDPQ